ncbi:MAG: hypothetical protein JWO02_2376, partial [Solirubrobacterales bacterium]|nr:hypothetical protein [Solirubrobacterales bacterium]
AATVSTCTTGLTAADRVAVFTGSMPTVRDAVSMGMRFDLYERDGDIGPLRRLVVPNFGGWQRSVPDVAGFVYDKRVEMLQAPASYRVRVRFHWYDAKGKVIRRAERMSALCRQPDLRADLRVVRLVVGGGEAGGITTYTVTLRNAGATAATVPFATGLSIDGVAQPVQRVGPLAAGGLLTLTFEAPRCTPGGVVVATADIGKAVDEADETDNATRTSCPET